MRRRSFLGGSVSGSLAAVAGCLGGDDGGPPPVLDDRPSGIYRPTHAPRAVHVATRRAGPYAVGLLYSLPARFWIVDGRRAERRSVRDGDDLHLMATVWDPRTGRVLPSTGVTVSVPELDRQEVVYPMIDQRMGFHYGDNVALDGPGEYEVRVDVAGTAVRRTGGFVGRFDDPAGAAFSLRFDDGTLADLSYERPANAGETGAVERPSGSVPAGVAPPVDALPGRVLGAELVDGARYVVAVLDPPRGVDGDGTYLAVSVRTRYNRIVVPGLGLRGAVRRDGRTVHEGALGRALDPRLGHHYGAPVPGLRAGDSLELSVITPPQVARHEGYETALTDAAGFALSVASQ